MENSIVRVVALILVAFTATFVFMQIRSDRTTDWTTVPMQTVRQLLTSVQSALAPSPTSQVVGVETSLPRGNHNNKDDTPPDSVPAGSSNGTATVRESTGGQPSPIMVKRTTPSPAGESKQGLKEVDCGPKCSWDYAPAVSDVEWLERPTVSVRGVLSLRVAVGENDALTLPNNPGGGASNIALTDGGTTLYGSVIPPAPPGMTWNPAPGQWVSDVYSYHDSILNIRATINPKAASQPSLTLCLWTGGHGTANRVLDCVPVSRP